MSQTQAASNGKRSHCWKCGTADPLNPPPPTQQVEIVRMIQRTKPPLWWWSDDELAHLLDKLRPGDAFVAVFAGSVRFARCEHKQVFAIDIDRDGTLTRVKE